MADSGATIKKEVFAEEEIELEFKKKMLLAIQDDYKCSLCQSLPRPGFFPMRMCNYLFCPKKFRICTPCYANGTRYCSNCSSMTASLSTDTLSEKVFKELPFQCQNSRYGCQQVLMAPKLLEHESVCLYSKIHCALRSCSVDICYAKFMDHFTKNHEDIPTYFDREKKLTMTLPKDGSKSLEFPISTFTAYDRIFFDVGFQNDEHIFRWLYVLATTEEAKNFRVQYSLEHDGKKLQWCDALLLSLLTGTT